MEPDTPRGIPVDQNGIALDTDLDGVPDEFDHQPGTPFGAVVNTDGIAQDSDGDGVLDGIDREPETIHGAVVDEHGVAVDSDLDGVPDGIDQERQTPRGITVDAAGRAIIRQEYSLFTDGMVRLNSIPFAAGGAEIQPDSYGILDEIGQLLRQYPYLVIQIGGHTDSLGDPALNYRVSRERALAVRDYLIERFPDIAIDRLQAVGYGSEKPIASNDTAQGRSQNRRVEFVIINQPETKKESQ
jgi:OOP family OmpA-OmpF porin